MAGKYRRKYVKKKKPLTKRTAYKVYARRRTRSRYHTSIPSVMKVRLKYQDVYGSGTLNAASPTSYIIWRPNDLFDPLYSGAGHQSMFHDQWYGLYYWGRCPYFKFNIGMVNSSSYPIHVCMILLQDYSVTTYDQACEMKGARRTVVTAEKPARLSLKCNVDRFLHNKRGTVLSDDSFKQDMGTALPLKAGVFLHIYYKYFPTVGSADLIITYEMTQYCQFSEPIIQAQS